MSSLALVAGNSVTHLAPLTPTPLYKFQLFIIMHALSLVKGAFCAVVAGGTTVMAHPASLDSIRLLVGVS
jgi:acyl-CoA reductase-like NAD-dependent aldehyde dehydrogenase